MADTEFKELTVRVSKTIQERQYEPVTIEVTVKSFVREEDFNDELAFQTERCEDHIEKVLSERKKK